MSIVVGCRAVEGAGVVAAASRIVARRPIEGGGRGLARSAETPSEPCLLGIRTRSWVPGPQGVHPCAPLSCFSGHTQAWLSQPMRGVSGPWLEGVKVCRPGAQFLSAFRGRRRTLTGPVPGSLSSMSTALLAPRRKIFQPQRNRYPGWR